MTLYGWDASHYDGVPSGARVVAEGFDFMTHKAGGDKADVELGAWWNAVKAHRITEADLRELFTTGTVPGKILPGAYWVLYPGTPATRAEEFLARLDSQCPGWRDGPFILQADCEKWGGNPATMPGKADIKAFCDRLRLRAPKLMTLVYASHGQYHNELTGLGYPLWNADYPSSRTGPASAIYSFVDGDSGRGWQAYSGQTPAIWQFTSSATIAGQTTCDANAFRGTLADLVALVAPGWETDVTPNDLLVTHIVAGGTDYGSLNGVLATLMQRTNALKGVGAVPSADDVAQAVIVALSQLPGVTVTEEQLQAAFVGALKQLASGS